MKANNNNNNNRIISQAVQVVKIVEVDQAGQLVYKGQGKSS
jgi:hypothetical protein